MEIILYVDKTGPQKMKHIGETFGIKFSTLTSLVDKIEDAGLIKRVNSKDDRRSVLITLSKKGKKLVDEYDQQAIEYSEVIAKQPNDSQDLFNSILEMLTPANKNASGAIVTVEA
jgi:DNA-binding MarR family transcriptional regulator